jgi:hypothetical protein
MNITQGDNSFMAGAMAAASDFALAELRAPGAAPATAGAVEAAGAAGVVADGTVPAPDG